MKAAAKQVDLSAAKLKTREHRNEKPRLFN